MIPPVNLEEKIERLIQFVEMVNIDGQIDADEMKLVNKYGIALGFSSEDLEKVENKTIEEITKGSSRSETLEIVKNML